MDERDDYADLDLPPPRPWLRQDTLSALLDGLAFIGVLFVGVAFVLFMRCLVDRSY